MYVSTLGVGSRPSTVPRRGSVKVVVDEWSLKNGSAVVVGAVVDMARLRFRGCGISAVMLRVNDRVRCDASQGSRNVACMQPALSLSALRRSTTGGCELL